MEKSHVTMEQHVCVVCGKPFDTGALLIDNRLRQVFDRHTKTGWGMCPEHQRLKDEGFIAFVGCDESKSPRMANGNMSPEDAYRTGTVLHMKRELAARIFNVPMPDHGVAFCGEDVIQKLRSMVPSEEQHGTSLKSGDPVKICRGELAGAEGNVLRVSSVEGSDGREPRFEVRLRSGEIIQDLDSTEVEPDNR